MLLAAGCADPAASIIGSGNPTTGGMVSGDAGVQMPPDTGSPEPGAGGGTTTTGEGPVAMPDGGTSADAGSGDKGCGEVKETAQVERLPVDVVIALDSSGSMSDEICRVSENLATFVDGVGPNTRVSAAYQVGIDLIAQLVFLCGKDDPFQGSALGMDASRYNRVDVRVDSNNAFEVLLNQFSSYSSFLREGSPTHFIVVSDDESNMPAEMFRTQMEAKLGHPFYFHAIVATGGGCSGSGVGQQYLDLAAQTGGEQLSICESDWTALFTQLEKAVVAATPLPCSFEIPAPPSGQLFSPDKVSVDFTPPEGTLSTFPKAPDAAACEDRVGWHFDDAANPKRIEFCPAACESVKGGGDLAIAFGCEPPDLI